MIFSVQNNSVRGKDVGTLQFRESDDRRSVGKSNRFGHGAPNYFILRRPNVRFTPESRHVRCNYDVS
jgi:hypothetical protein